jgi:hypothetical protein
MRGKSKRLSKKEYLQLLRQRADEEANARIESEKRQKRIRELRNLITSGKLVPRGDKSEQIASDLKSEIESEVFGEWETVNTGKSDKAVRRRDRDNTQQTPPSNELVRSLVELVGLQEAEISHMWQSHHLCEWAKTHAPKELAALREKLSRMLWAVVKPATKLTPKQASEWQRRGGQRREEVGLIEFEFGGQAKARAGIFYTPICLDDIFRGYPVTMEYLEILFGLERHRLRFVKDLPTVRDEHKVLYSAFHVVRIMDVLLWEKPTKRKRGARGGSEKKLWPSNPEVKKRVLFGIANRAFALSTNRSILDTFRAVVCRHLAIGYPKEQLPQGVEYWASIAHRYLD